MKITGILAILAIILISRYDKEVEFFIGRGNKGVPLLSKMLYIEDITWRRGDTKFLFEC